MTTLPSVIPLLILALFVICGLVRLAEQECRDQAFANLMRKYTALRPFDKIMVGLLLAVFCQHGGSKPTNWLQEISGPQIETNTVDAAEQDEDDQDSGMDETPLSNEFPRLTSNQYAAGFALLTRTYTNATWLTVPSNAIAHAPWTRYGLAEDTFWLSATNWAFILGTNAVGGAHVSSSGTLSFDPATPKGSPRAREMPDGDSLSFLAPLQGSLGTVPPLGRFWHAVTTNSSVLMTWQNLYAGRDTNTPVTFQAELYSNGDFVYRYAFTNALTLTNFVIGAQHNGGGETYALNDTNKLVNGLELRWRAFGVLDPGVDDHDGDGLSTYEEVMTHDSDPTMPDTDLDGLGDAQEDPVNGPFPRNRDSDNDGFTDGADPHPMSADSAADLDGDGQPDAWEVHAFGGTNVTDNANADTNGDGFSDRVSMLAGICPTNAPAPGFAVTNAAAVAGIDAWEIAPAFALDMQAGLTNVSTRTLQISRTSPWQQYFVSSDPRSAQAWSLDGLELSWAAVTNVTGTASASPAGDSMRLALSSNLAGSVTFRLSPSRAAGLLRCVKPLYLVRWTPQLSFIAGATVAAATPTSGIPHVAGILGSGGAAALPFTLDAQGRPHKSAPGAGELAELALPPDPGSEVYPVFTSGISDGYLTAPGPSQAVLPACGTNIAVRVLLYKPEVVRWEEPGAESPLGQFSTPYPLSTPSLRSQWKNNAAGTGSSCSGGFSVTAGLDSDAFCVRINGRETDSHLWDDPGPASAQIRFCDVTNVWEETVWREPETGGDESEPPPNGGDDCECGGGDSEGATFNSLKFRIPLGGAGRDRISGFLWFAMETPQPVSLALFNVLADPLVTVSTNCGTVTVSSPVEGGRTLAVSNVAHGVWVWVSDWQGSPEHRWEITNPQGDTNAVRLVKRDQAGNALRDETFTGTGGSSWTRTDALSGSAETLAVSGSLEADGERTECRTIAAGGVTLSSAVTVSKAVGFGGSAVARVTESKAWDACDGRDLSVHSQYWEDSLHALRNGRLRLRFGDGVAWEYHSYDSRGRETLRAGPLNGSARPAGLETADISTVAELAALQGLSGLATAYDYTPDEALGDSADFNDSRNPRAVTSYAVRDGAAQAIAKEWRVFTRSATNTLQTLCVRTVRACSPSAAFGNAGNVESLTVSYAGSEATNSVPALWNLPLREEREDGSVQTWAYEFGNYNPSTGEFVAEGEGGHLRVTSKTGTKAHPDGIAGASTYTVEIRDAAFGRTLARETRLNNGGTGDPALSWEKTAYDARGRMQSTSYSDGTSETNVWDCCHLQSKIGRDGRRTEFWSDPTRLEWSAVAELSVAAMPGVSGRYPVTETATDPLGRETNSVRSVWFNGSRDSAYAALITRTEYPCGTDGYRITTDPLGVRTLSRRICGEGFETEETVSAVVTSRRTRYPGGATVTEKLWRDAVSGASLSLRTRTETSWDAGGCETETVSVSNNNGPWMTQSLTVRDFLGREVTRLRAGYGGSMLVTSNAYDSAGRTMMTANHDGSKTVYAYDALGNGAGTVRIGAGQQLSFDPQSFTLANVIAMDEYVVTETPAWKEGPDDLGLSGYGVPSARWDCNATVLHNPGQGAVTASVQRVQLTVLSAACVRRSVATDINGAVTLTTESLDAGNARTTVTSVNTATEVAETTVSVAGVQVSGTNSLGGVTSNTFDGFARQVTSADTAGSRTLQRATGYHGDGSVAFSAEICGTVSNVTSYSQRQYLQEPEHAYAVTSTDALGNGTVNYYSGDGKLYRSEGAVYPTATARDTDGRQSELWTWRDQTGNPDITRWHYDVASGLVTNKVYADGKGPAYSYIADGRMASRTWARGTVTGYGYADTACSSAITVSYNDGTPAVSNGYNLAGQLVYVSDGTGGRTLSYNAKGQQTAETNSLAAITRHHDGLGRDAGYVLNLPGFSADTFSVSYGFDGNGRIDRVTSVFNGVTNTFRYSFLQGTAIVTGMTNSAGQGWMRTYEPARYLIAAVSNFWSGTAVSSFGYENDALGRRTLRLDAAPSLSATNVFAYNQRSEVTNAAMGSANYSYSFDDIGNRKSATAGSSLNTYAANALNQYTVVTNAGISLPVGYDLDGNMTVNGEWLYDWDGENNLWLAQQAVQTNGSLQVENGYDYLKRRWYKRVDVLTGQEPPSGSPPMPGDPGFWMPSKTTYYVWDGWNIAAEINIDVALGTTNVMRYVWGLDLSGSIQGAGGVGGLLAVIEGDGSTYFPCYDANGNITEYVDESGTVRAHREFDAFGNTTAKSGDLADSFRFWFSTKYLDEETGNYVYQQRQDIPSLGRWASRDPIGEKGGLNLFGYCENDSTTKFDINGNQLSVITIGAIVSLVETVIHKVIYSKSFDVFPANCQDRQRHCWVNCVSTKVHGGWVLPALAASIFKEINDLKNDGELEDSIGDMIANLYGQSNASWSQSCKKTCMCTAGARKGSCCDNPTCEISE